MPPVLIAELGENGESEVSWEVNPAFPDVPDGFAEGIHSYSRPEYLVVLDLYKADPATAQGNQYARTTRRAGPWPFDILRRARRLRQRKAGPRIDPFPAQLEFPRKVGHRGDRSAIILS